MFASQTKLAFPAILRRTAAMAVLVYACSSQAAEIRGRVELVFPHGASPDHGGLPVSVAVIPLEGQAVEPSPPVEHQVRIKDTRIQPPYLAIRPGERVVFVNQDAVFHELYTRFETEPFSIRLAKAGRAGHRMSVPLHAAGERHVFCRIHRSAYARMDVVRAPYLQILKGGGEFEFRGLKPGRWRIRVATVGSALHQVEARAFTAPQPMHIRLPVNRGRRSGDGVEFQGRDVEALFPGGPRDR